MTGKTHLAVGAAAALLAAGPGAPVSTLALAAACGAVGATLPDLDVRDTSHPWRERIVRTGAAALLAGAALLDAANGGAVLHEAVAHGLGPLAVGLVALAGLICAARLSTHRGFSHSLLALAGCAGATYLVCPPLAPYAALGFATHLALDALTYRGLRLFWPLRRGLSLRLCHTGGVVDACCLAAATLTIILTVTSAVLA